MQRKLAAILAADVVGYSRLMGIDEQGTLTRLQALRRELFDPEITRHGGHVVKLMGDGAIVEFSSVVAAVECAVSLQQRLLEYNASFDEAERLQFRIGINSGDVIIQGDDLYGDGVNVAARLESIAEIGGVCVSGTVFDQVRTKVDFSFADLGEQALKNIEEPIRAFRILVGQNGGTANRQSTGARVMDLLPQQKPSIALLPFQDLTPDNEPSYLADGMRLGIQAGLVLLPGLFLINAPAVKPFGDHRISEAEAARALGVRYLLGGAVQSAGQRMRATFQLTDTKNGEIVWSERYDRDLTDIFELQDEITREVLVSLNVRVMGRDVTRFWFRRLTHPKARELFMHGNFHLYSGGAQHNEEARRIFEQLHDLDPDVGHGSGAVALTHWLDAFFGWSESPERSRELARRWATTAIAYSEADGFGHAVLGHLQLYDRAFDAALDQCRMAVALRSSCPLAFGLLASVQVYCGDNRSAIKNARMALQLERVYPPWLINVLASAYRDSGDVEQAIVASKEVVRMAPETIDGRVVLCSACMFDRQTQEAARLVEDILVLQPSFTLSDYAERQPYQDASVLEEIVAGLRTAGLPE